jgi:hypothetical protein
MAPRSRPPAAHGLILLLAALVLLLLVVVAAARATRDPLEGVYVEYDCPQEFLP